MTGSKTDIAFTGSIPEAYEKHLVPLIFDFYATDLARRLAARNPKRVLEIAAGTGVVTRALASALPASTSIVATDLMQPMLDQARAAGTTRPVEWRQADAMQLPFEAGTFDAVICQFGVMFFSDKAKAFSEIRRVLAQHGVFMFSVWDSLAENDFADAVNKSLVTVFPQDPPGFLPNRPYGYFDLSTIAHDLAAGGFAATPQIETITIRTAADSPWLAAVGFCQGTPLRNEIEARDASRLDEATEVAAQAIAQRFGAGRVEGRIQAHIFTVEA